MGWKSKEAERMLKIFFLQGYWQIGRLKDGEMRKKCSKAWNDNRTLLVLSQLKTNFCLAFDVQYDNSK